MRQPNPINIRRIDHVVIRANDLDRMLDFYCDVLGCRLERGPGDIGLAQLRAGCSLIDIVAADGPIGRSGGAAPDHAAPNMDHVCLLVEPWDRADIEAHLAAHGVESGDVEARYGATGQGPSLYLKDPEGNTVELKGRT
ncbi:VOC family protein [Elongatibacter sediminis]|uniref:VOC family protein n=1 Tax=Elongatibacter sediminis TaxID=3119006 RepID=A0AAW9R8P3_9GAMM